MDKKSKIPLYMTVLEILKERIITGEYGLHTFMPTENELEKEFNVSKITIRKAIAMLETEGFVTKKSGSGTKVISNGLYNILTRTQPFSKTLTDEGFTFRRENTKVTRISLAPQDELYQFFGAECYKITRKYFLDGVPYIYYTHYLLGEMKLDEVSDDERFSIYMQMYKNKRMISHFKDEFYIDYPSTQILEELKLKEGPTLGRKRTTYGINGEVLEISYSQYNTRMHNYVINFDV